MKQERMKRVLLDVVVLVAVLIGVFAVRAEALTADRYISDVVLVISPTTPPGLKRCDGAVVPSYGNESLAFLLNWMYGGNQAQRWFKLPDMQADEAAFNSGASDEANVPVRYYIATEGFHPTK